MQFTRTFGAILGQGRDRSSAARVRIFLYLCGINQILPGLTSCIVYQIGVIGEPGHKSAWNIERNNRLLNATDNRRSGACCSTHYCNADLCSWHDRVI